jgi:hypothetical protein
MKRLRIALNLLDSWGFEEADMNIHQSVDLARRLINQIQLFRSFLSPDGKRRIAKSIKDETIRDFIKVQDLAEMVYYDYQYYWLMIEEPTGKIFPISIADLELVFKNTKYICRQELNLN